MPVRLEKLERDTYKKQKEIPKSGRRSKECERFLTEYGMGSSKAAEIARNNEMRKFEPRVWVGGERI